MTSWNVERDPRNKIPLAGRRLWLLLAALTLLAALPRLVALDGLSYYGDEETSTFPAHAVAEGEGPVMPSGMTYRRGLTYTWIAAGTARVFGLDRDLSYRLPSALLGMLTVPLLFLFGRRHLGTGVALVAATALALSEWHLVFSRMARMYAPFLFFFLAAGLATWRWAETGRLRDLILAAAVFAAAALTHSMAVFAAMFALIPIGLKSSAKVDAPKLLGFALIAAGASRTYDRLLVDAPFSATERPSPVRDGAGAMSDWPYEALATSLGPEWLLAGAGVVLGVWAGVAALRAEDGGVRLTIRSVGMIVLAAVAGGLLALGQLWGAAALGLVFLFVLSADRLAVLQRAWLPLALATLLGAGSVAADVLSMGAMGGLKEAVSFPFPYPLYLFREFPLIVLAFSAVCVWAAVRPARSDRLGLRAVLLATLLPILAVGCVQRWGPLRFLLPAYPFLLLCASAALVALASWAADRVSRLPRWSVVGAPLLLVLAGLAPGHGLAAAWNVVTLRHGEPVTEAIHQHSFRPDHEGAGRYVKNERRPGDLLVAEDPLQQYWYAGDVDFWFRSLNDARKFLQLAPDGSLRDMYVGSRLIADPADLDSLVRHAEGRVWFVTSGERVAGGDFYLDEGQEGWLDSLERTRQPLHVARDSVTSVYCLNCP